LRIAQEAKQKDNLRRYKRGKKGRPLWLFVDDARAIISQDMDEYRDRGKAEVEQCIYMYGEDGWNTVLVYHNAREIPKGIIKESDFIICSRLDKEDANYLPDDAYRRIVTSLYVKPYHYYNEWACRSKDGKIRKFFAIDSPIGLR
jgi:hypothetical protein